MAIKKRNKVIAQFNMSSLTDIIFLLLIFFMLTSSLIVPNALNLKLPGSSSSISSVSKQPDMVRISRNGQYAFNGSNVSRERLYRALVDRKREMKGRALNVSVAPHPNTPNQYVVDVLDMAYQLQISAILLEGR